MKIRHIIGMVNFEQSQAAKAQAYARRKIEQIANLESEANSCCVYCRRAEAVYEPGNLWLPIEIRKG